MFNHSTFDHRSFDQHNEWGPAKNRSHPQQPHQQQQQQQRQTLDQRDVSEQRPDDN